MAGPGRIRQLILHLYLFDAWAVFPAHARHRPSSGKPAGRQSSVPGRV